MIWLCKWHSKNAKRIFRILQCFYLASRLQINLLKRKLIVVGFQLSQVEGVASLVGSVASWLPYLYLGITVEQHMARVDAWMTIFYRITEKSSVRKA